jgi:hypothetical protein
MCKTNPILFRDCNRLRRTTFRSVHRRELRRPWGAATKAAPEEELGRREELTAPVSRVSHRPDLADCRSTANYKSNPICDRGTVNFHKPDLLTWENRLWM